MISGGSREGVTGVHGVVGGGGRGGGSREGVIVCAWQCGRWLCAWAVVVCVA